MELQPDSQDDTRRTMLALMVIMGLIVVWSVFTQRPRTPQPAAETEEQQAEETEKAKAPEKKPKTRETKAPAKDKDKHPENDKDKAPEPPQPPEPEPRPEPSPKTEPELQHIARQSDLLALVFTSQDGAIESLTLRDHFRTPAAKDQARRAFRQDPDADVSEFGLPLLGQAGAERSVVLADRPDGAVKGDGEALVLQGPLFEPRRFAVVETDEPREVAFRATFGRGRLRVTKTYRLPEPDEALQRHVDLEIAFENLADRPLVLPGYRLVGPAGIAAEQGPASWDKAEPTEAERKSAAGEIYGYAATENDAGKVNVDREKVSSLQKKDLALGGGRVLWAAAQSTYFAAILQPLLDSDERPFAYSGGAQSLGELNASAHIDSDKVTLAKGERLVHRYRLYVGPKTPKELARYDAHYEAILRSRWLDPLSNLMAWILNAAYSLIPNYGIAIIILTILVRIALHPLSKKSQTSMQKMQKLQPQMLELREKFKNDKRRQQEETMKLYREYGVNPLGGCLPLFLQIPVFIGLWRSLRESIGLRHAPFVLWIRDLSQPDNLFPGVNLLPIACCVVMFIQQRMMPKSPDPQQQQTQKIMGYMMPVFLGFLFYSMPSGLSLYFLATTLIGIAEQKVIRHHLDKMGDLKPVAPSKPSKMTRKAITRKPARPTRRKAF